MEPLVSVPLDSKWKPHTQHARTYTHTHTHTEREREREREI